VTDIT